MSINLLELQKNEISVDIKDYVIGVYGATGHGKSTLAANFPDPLFIATDIGYKTLAVHAQPVFSWTELLTLKAQLALPEVKAKFKTIVIDTIDMLLFYLTDHICRNAGVQALGDIPYGKGYADLQKALRNFLTGIQAQGYGIVMLLHSSSSTVGEGENAITRSDVKMSDTLKNIVVGMMDILAYIHIEQNGERFLCFQPTAFYNAKTRFTEIVDYCPLSYDSLEKSIVEAVHKAADKLGTSIVQKSTLYDDKPEVTNEEFLSKKEETLALAGELLAQGKTQLVQEIITASLGGQKLSEVTIEDFDKIVAIYSELSLH